MGNRGDLHAGDGTLARRRWRGKRWITCTLKPGEGPGVSFDTPGRYYPLFFYDDAVALAAGHRPCAACRRPAFESFIAAWSVAHGAASIVQNDEALHVDRLRGVRQRCYRAQLHHLPAGTFVSPMDQSSCPMLWWAGHLLPWSHAGYGRPVRIDSALEVKVHTPGLIVEMLKRWDVRDRSNFLGLPLLIKQQGRWNVQRLGQTKDHEQRRVAAASLDTAYVGEVYRCVDG